MLRYLVEVVQNLLSAGILTALLFASIYHGEKGAEKEAARKKETTLSLWACAAGGGASLILAVLRKTTALINRSAFNAWILFFAVFFGAVYMFFLWGGGRKRLFKKRAYLTESLGAYIRALLVFALLFYALPSIFLYPAEFVLAGESAFTTSFLFKLTGFASGLIFTAVVATAFYKTALRVPKKFFKIVITAAILINMCGQIIIITQFLLAHRIIPMIRWVFKFIVAASPYTSAVLYVLMALGFLTASAAFAESFKPAPPCGSPAQRRKVVFLKRLNRRRCLTAVAGFALSVFLFTFVKSYIKRGVELSPAEPITIVESEILIPVSQVEDGRLHRFAYTAAENVEVRFIVIKKNEAAYGVGLDACDICGPTGYYERKNEVICRLCDVVMNKSTIGFKGGCNPVPLSYSIRNGSMVIETINLENERNRFK
ncbi:MAG: Fe-S-containing protein [Spirochaetaceae bacterium]|jgi:uncharacterized membrane protein|nr:Fe-S-containing protein [Spirochaetaceae bacterium]